MLQTYPTLGSTTMARGLTILPAVKVARCDPFRFATYLITHVVINKLY